MTDQPLLTVGHSSHDFRAFVELLERNSVTALVDVRTTPASRFAPQFNRGHLAPGLPSTIRYAFMGDSLGGRPSAPEFYDEAGHVLYSRLSRQPEFISGLETLEKARGRESIAILCSEADPLHCHRFLLITRVLAERGADPARLQHILGDGSLVPESKLPRQPGLMEEATWKSPLSVLQAPPLSTSSSDYDQRVPAH